MNAIIIYTVQAQSSKDDICAKLKPCDQICQSKVVGSNQVYSCACSEGFTLDQTKCVRKYMYRSAHTRVSICLYCKKCFIKDNFTRNNYYL